MSKKKKKGMNYSTMRCPYCGSTVVFRSAEGIYKRNAEEHMLYVCKRYPECDAYVTVHKGTRIPMGIMADGKLRKLRIDAHHAFDRLHESGMMSRREAYDWLAYMIQSPLSQAHIGELGEYYCNVVIKESRNLYRKLSANRGEA